jgi:ArsR family transcriptional regulator, arsenate/arsenite/antimonite-responsive transcriptional repressor / arsenate reductase (thioredoxin)
MENMILDRLTTLGHPQRIAVFRLLVRRYPDAVPAGEIAAALEIKSSTLSVYLAALKKVELVVQSRQGTSVRYQAAVGAVAEVTDFLMFDCCKGRPELCHPSPSPTLAEDVQSDAPKHNVLFLCSGNSARSIFAEAILRSEAGDRFNVYSAGMHPKSEMNPFAVEMLASKGHDISGLRSKNTSEFQTPDAPVMDFVFTVCDQAANEECAAWYGQPISAHWGIADPVSATGTDAEKRLAFQQAYGQLRNRILAFVALPFPTLDRTALQANVDTISTIKDI